MTDVTTMAVADVRVDCRLRARDDSKVESLASSIATIGLLNPIVVDTDGRLVAGLHRLEAHRMLGLADIDVRVLKLDDIDAELAQIDENLMRNELSALERDEHFFRRDELLGVRGERREAGALPGTNNREVKRDTVSPFKHTADIAAEMGVSKRGYQRGKQIARDIAPDVRDAIRHTPVADSTTQLLDLARMPAHEQRAVVETIVTGAAKDVTQAKRARKEQQREAARQENADKISSAVSIESVLEMGAFSTIVIDPPWDWGDEGDVDQMGRARPKYQTMSIDDLKAMPIGEMADDNAHIYLWITNRSLPKGFDLLDAWGFRYITCITWVKPSFGMGNYFRGQTEQVLFGVRGSMPLRRKDAPTYFEAPRGAGGHSSKPAAFVGFVESCSPGPYLEVFAREKREGWTCWGGEV